MTVVESPLPCSRNCVFEEDCAKKYSLGICNEIIDAVIDKFVTEPLEEKVVQGNKITAAMTDSNGTVTVSKGRLIVNIKTKRRS